MTIAGGTKIEWADFTFNPWWGCEKVSPGCAHCYADTLSKRYAAGQRLWGAGHGFRFFGDAHWRDPLKWAKTAPAKLGRRPRVFCASMADVFEDRPELEQPRERLFDLIALTYELDWLVLTKRPEKARDWLAARYMPRNLWLGVSIENARFTWRADVLREIPAAVRFISAEPLLGSLFPPERGPKDEYDDQTGYPWHDCICNDCRYELGHMPSCPRYGQPADRLAPLDLTGIDWVIVGGESGARARAVDLEWIRQLVSACREHDVAPFVKQLGRRPYEHLRPDLPHLKFVTEIRDAKGGDWDEWPPDLRVREFPPSPVSNSSRPVQQAATTQPT